MNLQDYEHHMRGRRYAEKKMAEPLTKQGSAVLLLAVFLFGMLAGVGVSLLVLFA